MCVCVYLVACKRVCECVHLYIKLCELWSESSHQRQSDFLIHAHVFRSKQTCHTCRTFYFISLFLPFHLCKLQAAYDCILNIASHYGFSYQRIDFCARISEILINFTRYYVSHSTLNERAIRHALHLKLCLLVVVLFFFFISILSLLRSHARTTWNCWLWFQYSILYIDYFFFFCVSVRRYFVFFKFNFEYFSFYLHSHFANIEILREFYRTKTFSVSFLLRFFFVLLPNQNHKYENWKKNFKRFLHAHKKFTANCFSFFLLLPNSFWLDLVMPRTRKRFSFVSLFLQEKFQCTAEWGRKTEQQRCYQCKKFQQWNSSKVKKLRQHPASSRTDATTTATAKIYILNKRSSKKSIIHNNCRQVVV